MIASAVQSSVEAKRRFECRYDRRFFSAMSILIFIIVFIGFALSHGQKGVNNAKRKLDANKTPIRTRCLGIQVAGARP
jgi:hypothetical protein